MLTIGIARNLRVPELGYILSLAFPVVLAKDFRVPGVSLNLE